MDEQLVEAIAKKSHETWLRSHGVRWPSVKDAKGNEWSVPWDQLSEDTKRNKRISVRFWIQAIHDAGYTIVAKGS